MTTIRWPVVFLSLRDDPSSLNEPSCSLVGSPGSAILVLGWKRADVEFASKCGVNRWHQVVASSHFEHVAEGAQRQATAHHHAVGMDRCEHDARGRMPFQDRFCCHEATHAWHTDVGDDDVRSQFVGCFDQRLSIADGAHDLELGFEERPPPLKSPCVIVSEQHPSTIHRVTHQLPATFGESIASIKMYTEFG